MSRITMISAALAAVIVCGATVDSAHAFTHYTERQIYSLPYATSSDDWSVNGNGVRDTSGAASEFGWSGSGTWGRENSSGVVVFRPEYADVYAKADLSTGQLKARSILEVGAHSPAGAANPYGGYAAMAGAHAGFGDTFRLTSTGGLPYLGGNGDQFQFRFSIDGQTSLAPGQASPPIDGSATSYAMVWLTVYRAGEGFAAIEAWNNFTSTHPYNDNWNNPEFQAELTRLDNAIGSAMIGSRRSWTLGDALVPPDWYGSSADAIAMPLDANGRATIDYSFAAAGDFEFTLDLFTQVAIDGSYENMRSAIDFSHTLTTGFSAPAGVTVASASGLFPGTIAAVPEPETYAMMLAGLGVLGFVGRRRRAG